MFYLGIYPVGIYPRPEEIEDRNFMYSRYQSFLPPLSCDLFPVTKIILNQRDEQYCREQFLVFHIGLECNITCSSVTFLIIPSPPTIAGLFYVYFQVFLYILSQSAKPLQRSKTSPRGSYICHKTM